MYEKLAKCPNFTPEKYFSWFWGGGHAPPPPTVSYAYHSGILAICW